MILASLLSAVFVFMMCYSVVFVRHAATRVVLLVAYSAAIVFVWNPEATTVIANRFGIGRGLDFIFVLFSVAIVNGIFFIVMHLNSQHESITKLTRHIAIRDARSPTELPPKKSSVRDAH
jgi:hypothetical protein